MDSFVVWYLVLHNDVLTQECSFWHRLFPGIQSSSIWGRGHLDWFWCLHEFRLFFTFEQGLAAAVQLNQYLEENAIIQLDQKAGKDQGKFQVISGVLVKFTLSMMQVNFKKLENSVKDRVTQYVTLQHSGDKEAVDK